MSERARPYLIWERRPVSSPSPVVLLPTVALAVDAEEPMPFVANIPAPDAYHAPGTPAEHRCEARIWAQCTGACRQTIVMCSPADADLRAIMAKRWRCLDCRPSGLAENERGSGL